MDVIEVKRFHCVGRQASISEGDDHGLRVALHLGTEQDMGGEMKIVFFA